MPSQCTEALLVAVAKPLPNSGDRAAAMAITSIF